MLTLQRVGVTNVVRVTDEAKSFTRTLTMPGDGWNISAWSYDLAMADGSGTIGDTVTIDTAGIRTEKFFVAFNVEKMVKMVAGLGPISQAEYDARLGRMLKQP